MIIKDIFLFNHRLNDYEYIIPNNGNIITQIKEYDFDKYKYLTPLEFEKYHGGICWDYVTYQAYYFKKYFPSIEYKIFFKCFINDEDNPTHSFMIFKYHNIYYWFESSWKNEKGIKSYKSEKSAINDIMNRMKMFDKRSFKKEFLIEYNPLDPVLFGMNHNQIMNYMYNIVKMNRLKLMESVLNTHQLIQERSNNIKLYFLTKVDMKDFAILQPRIPQNFLIDNGYEDGKTKRVCFSTSINGALMGLSQNLKNTDLYVYQPEGIVKSDIYRPSLSEVPDKSITGEVWIKQPVNIKFIGKIHVKDAKNKPYKYKYGNNTAELYDWNWEWIDKNINESVTSILNKIHSSRSKLNKYNSESLTIDILNKYKKQYRNLSHIKINDSTDGRIYTDNGKVVAIVNTQKKADGSIWIQGLEVFGKYRGQELSYGLLDIAVRELRSNHLSVRKTNSKAIKLYNNYGFITYKQDNYMQYMHYRCDNMNYTKDSNTIKENTLYNIIEACKDLESARKFVLEVGKLAKKYDANYFIVTDGASGTYNNGNPAVRNARLSQIEWKKENKFDPDEDWNKK